MKSTDVKSLFIKGIAGGLIFFFLGWFVYGFLLNNYMSAHSNPLADPIKKANEDMVWWAMILSNFAYSFLLAYIVVKSQSWNLWKHVKIGLVVGFLFSLTADLMSYSMMNLMSLSAVIVDILTMTILSGIIGLLISFVGNTPKEST